MNRDQCRPTMYHVVAHYAQLNPEKIAVLYNGQAFNYRTLLEKIQAVAVLLKKAEIVSGDRDRLPRLDLHLLFPLILVEQLLLESFLKASDS